MNRNFYEFAVKTQLTSIPSGPVPSPSAEWDSTAQTK